MSFLFPIAILNGTSFFFQNEMIFMIEEVTCQKLTIILIILFYLVADIPHLLHKGLSISPLILVSNESIIKLVHT